MRSYYHEIKISQTKSPPLKIADHFDLANRRKAQRIAPGRAARRCESGAGEEAAARLGRSHGRAEKEALGALKRQGIDKGNIGKP